MVNNIMTKPMENKQMTAVEWLLNEIADNYKTPRQWQEIAEQAKEMEREQIEKAYEKGAEESWDAEQYYNETYNK